MPSEVPHPTRRQLLLGATLLGTGAVMGTGVLAACGDSEGGGAPGTAKPPTERQQTLFVAGFQWGTAPNFNPLNSTAGFPTAYNQMHLVYESLFGFDIRDQSLQPQLGKSLAEPDGKTIVVELQPDAKWQDGQPVTADDVVFSFELNKRHPEAPSNGAWEYLAGVAKTGEKQVTFQFSPTRTNPGMVKQYLCQTAILPSHLWTKIEAENPNILEFLNMSPVGSGPYKLDSHNAQQLVYVRDDNYWGKAVRGKLPVPKKIVHPIFKDNAAGNLAFERGEVDAMQQFTPQIWKMWEDKDLPVKTWYDKVPYYLPGGMPMLVFNTTRKGLSNPKVRLALAHAIDYARIADQAMSRYSEPAKASLILPSEAERKYRDDAAISSAGWKYDPAKARQILEQELGAKKGSDGVYKLPDGTRLGPWTVQTPTGWTDWQTALQIVVENGKKAGFDLKANFPEANTLTPNMNTANFDLAVWWITAQTTAGTPWQRYRDVLDIRGVPKPGQRGYWNWGRYSDNRVGPLLDKAATATGEQQVQLIKQLDAVYREAVPMIPLMYRPLDFFEVNESVWKGFPTAAQPTAPPTFQGAGYLWLYEISPK
jgi:peptide/nickel transport system substrate-binding protein